MKFSGCKKLASLSLFCLLSFMVTAQKQAGSLFTLLPEKQTGISFLNTIKEDDSLNVMRYEYLYNGAGVGIGDFNNDGLPDIYFSGNTSPGKLFLNKGNFQFTDITKISGVEGNGNWATGVSIADVNGDGLPDIYVCHSGKYDDPEKLSNELFINQGVKNGIPVFKNMAKEYGLDAPGTQSTQAAFFDYDGDGDLDMFLLNHSNHTYSPFLNTSKTRSTPNFNFGNRLFRNDRDANGNMHFTDVTLQAGIINHALNFGLSVTISDINKDGWPDIYTTSDYTERSLHIFGPFLVSLRPFPGEGSMLGMHIQVWVSPSLYMRPGKPLSSDFRRIHLDVGQYAICSCCYSVNVGFWRQIWGLRPLPDLSPFLIEDSVFPSSYSAALVFALLLHSS